jgi:hypothetical protein
MGQTIIGQTVTALRTTLAKVAFGGLTLSVLSGMAVCAAANAQSANQSSNSSAALLGIQERSVQTTPAQPATPKNSQNQALEPNQAPPTLYRLDSKTRVILAPVRGASTDPMEIPIAGSSGDNRIQLQHDLKP